MRITSEEFKRIEHLLPVQRGNVKNDNLKFLNALLHVAEQGCKWRGLPREFGKWDSIYVKANGWSKSGVLDRAFAALQQERIIRVRIERASLDSTSIKLHQDARGAGEKTAASQSASRGAAGTQSFMWLPRMTRLQ